MKTKALFEHRADAWDIQMGVETHLVKGKALNEVRTTLRKKGWKRWVDPARLTSVGGTTGGEWVLGKKTPTTQSCKHLSEVRHWQARMVRTKGVDILLGAIYLKDGEGWSEENGRRIASLMALLGT